MSKILIFIRIMAVTVLLSVPTFSYAEFTLSPSITVREEYNDNLFLTGVDKEDDFITLISPHVDLEYHPNQYLDLDLAYGLDFRFYREHNELDDTSIKDVQYGGLELQVRPVNRVFIDISDVYSRVPTDVRDRFATENSFLNMSERNMLLVSPYTKLPISTTVSTTLGYRFENVWHEAEDLVNYDIHTAYITFIKRFSAQIDGTLNYEYFAYRPDVPDDQASSLQYDGQRGSVGLSYQINQALRVNGEIGQATYDFVDSNDYDLTFWDIDVEFNRGSTHIMASYGLSFNDSATAGSFEGQSIDLLLEQSWFIDLELNPYYSKDKYINSDREDRITGMTFNLSRQLTEKFNALIITMFESQKFLPEDVKVKRYVIGTTLEYNLSRSIITSVGYRFNERDSLDTDGFQNNMIWVQARLNY